MECKRCGGRSLKYFDTVKRIIKGKRGCSKWIDIKRVKCMRCGSYQRVLPDCLVPYKHYDSEIIFGVVEGLITPSTIGYEDYPCEMTMNRWIADTRKNLLLL